jgi:hypothetical protein
MFDLWVIVYIWAVFSITEVARVLGVLFSTIKVMYHFCPKMGWATTWAIFLQTSGHPGRDCCGSGETVPNKKYVDRQFSSYAHLVTVLAAD